MDTNHCWNIKIGKNTIVGAGSGMTKEVRYNTVLAGAPAVVSSDANMYLDKHTNKMINYKIFDELYTAWQGITSEKKLKCLKNSIKDRIY